MTTVNLSPLFNGTTSFGPTGQILAGGQLYTYQAGSSTPLATYTDYTGSVANLNPIILGSDGKLPNEMWLQYGFSYKFVLQDANSNLIDTYDNIAGIITSVPATSPAVPSGCILIWSGSAGSIPSGFVICDGTNGTPDLRNSFIIGAGNSYTVGQTGGSTSATLTQGNLPNVNFTTTITDPGHDHSYEQPGGSVGAFASATANSGPSTGTTGTATTGISIIVNSGGSNTPVSTLPPFYALCYIYKT